MSNNKSIVVLLASFNGEQFLSEQIESILLQKNVTLDLFISDDGSTDDTIDILNRFHKKFGNIKLLPKRPKDVPGPAKNFYYLLNSIDYSKYEFVALADQDDIWPEFKLSRAIECTLSTNAVAYSSDFINFYSNRKCKYYKKSNRQMDYDFLFETPGPGCSFVMTKDFALKVTDLLKQEPELSNFKYHDWLIYAIARSFNLKWVIDDSPNLFYRQHKNNFIGANSNFYGFYLRVSQILDGSWPDNVWFLYQNLYKILGNNLNITKHNFPLYFLLRFWKTRRDIKHKLLMVLFLLMMTLRRVNQ